MAHKYVLDTHTLVWYIEGNPRLGASAKGVIDDPGSDLILPIIALAEATYIVRTWQDKHSRCAAPAACGAS